MAVQNIIRGIEKQFNYIATALKSCKYVPTYTYAATNIYQTLKNLMWKVHKHQNSVLFLRQH